MFLNRYLLNSSSPLDYWHCNSLKYPHLYELHLLHHSIPATSAAMERHFSAAGYIVSPRLNSLADSSLEAMMMDGSLQQRSVRLME